MIMNQGPARLLRWLASGMVGATALAGGLGLDVAVVVNRASSNSLALGNLYCERRQVPPQNLIRIEWTGSRIEWTRAQCQSALVDPLNTELARRGLAAQIDYVVLSMDIPYRVTEGSAFNSTTAVLFYGFKTNGVPHPTGCHISPISGTGYYLSELALRPRPAVTNSPVYLATMLTGTSLESAVAVIERGVLSDGAPWTAPVLLQKTTDKLRNLRFLDFDGPTFNAQVTGSAQLNQTNSDATAGLTNLAGLSTGLAQFALGNDVFARGAVADSLTSYGGMLFENTGQTTLLACLDAGATGSYGTVGEPCNYPEKFPHPMVFFAQARGFSLAEAYYQSLQSPYQGLIVGEPLSAPGAMRGQGAWVPYEVSEPAVRRGTRAAALAGPPPTAPPTFAGVTNLSVKFTAADTTRPLDRVELYVDGTFAQTVTNVGPSEGNLLHARVNGVAIDHTVPAGATVPALAVALAARINTQTNATRVRAQAVGDRIELGSFDPARSGADIALVAGQTPGSAEFQTTFLRAARPRFLDTTTAHGRRVLEVIGTAGAGDYLTCTVTKTNGAVVVVGITNVTTTLTAVQLTRQLLQRIQANASLQGADGITGEELGADGTTDIQFLLAARGLGLPAAQVQVELRGSPALVVTGGAPGRLIENATDLEPRNHLYLSAGLSQLRADLAFDTTFYADGWHELTAVAREGTSVQTAARVSQWVLIRNTSLEAECVSAWGEGTVAIEAPLTFIVTANRTELVRIDLFGTGGRLDTVAGATNATFTVNGRELGPGWHSFYAQVVGVDGATYRTRPLRLHLVEGEAEFALAAGGIPPVLSWPATPGRIYEVLSEESPGGTETVEASLTAPAGNRLEWPLPDLPETVRFYRVRTPVAPALTGAGGSR